jgi:hypothetical protein
MEQLPRERREVIINVLLTAKARRTQRKIIASTPIRKMTNIQSLKKSLNKPSFRAERSGDPESSS